MSVLLSVCVRSSVLSLRCSVCVWLLSEFLVCASVSSVVCIMGLSACWTSAVVIKAHLLFHLPAFVCSVPFSVDHNTFKADDSKCETYNRYKSPWIYILYFCTHHRIQMFILQADIYVHFWFSFHSYCFRNVEVSLRTRISLPNTDSLLFLCIRWIRK